MTKNIEEYEKQMESGLDIVGLIGATCPGCGEPVTKDHVLVKLTDMAPDYTKWTFGCRSRRALWMVVAVPTGATWKAACPQCGTHEVPSRQTEINNGGSIKTTISCSCGYVWLINEEPR